MQVTLHYEAIVMQVTLHDKRIVMQVTLHYEAIVMQVTSHDKRIAMQVTLRDKRIVMQVTLHYEFKQKFPYYEEIDRGYIACGGNPKGGKIIGKDTIKTAERRNKTLIEAARTMLADLKLPTTFWAEAINIACYVQNRVAVVKPHNKTPYEPFHGKFDGKADEGFFVGYYLNSKALRVFNNRTRIVEENLHIRFSENTPNIVGSGPNWLFDIDALTKSMNYKPVIAGNQYNGNAGTKACDDADQEKENNMNITNNVNAAGTNEVNVVSANTNNELPFDPEMPELEDISTFTFSNKDEDDNAEANMNNLDITIQVSPTPTTRIYKDHPLDQVIGDLHSTTQTRNMSKNLEEHRIKAISLCLAYASFKDFVVYQMDVKSAFLYGKIEKEVYVCQPPGFEDPDFFDKVYKVKKALYGLHQAPRAWYETLSMYLLDNGFYRGKIDKILFIRRHKDDILLVQVYVDDIIFGSTKKELCNAFEKVIHEKFQMSFMGELTFFLGLQVKQKQDGIFISQDKYVAEILKKYGFLEVKNASIPMETQNPLLKDKDREEVDVHMYRLMIGSLMIFTYLKGHPKLGLWYSKDSPFDLVAYTDSDYAGASLDRKSTTGCCQYVGCRLISWQCKKQTVVANSTTKAEYVAASSCCGQATSKAKTVNREAQLQALVDGKKSKATPNDPGSQRTSSGGGPRFNTPRSGEHSLKLNELIELYTNLQNKVLDLETTKTSQAIEIESLKRRVKKLEKKQRSRTYKLKILYKVGLSARVESSDNEGLGKEDASKQRRISDIDTDDDITLVSTHDEQMLNVDQDLHGEEVFVTQQDKNVVEKEVDVAQVHVTTIATTLTISIDEATLAQALAELKHVKPKTKAKGIVFHKPEESTTTTTTTTITAWDDVQAKIDADYELAQRLQAKEQESSKKAKADITQEGSLKRAGDELEQERSKKQKVEDDKSL
nr:putative ribonuclease H-like domain-containing protein [Tanacetum cinerariifolium]